MLKETIQNLPQQFDYEPTIENHKNFQKKDKFIVCGMGGSNLAADIIRSWKPKLNIVVHRDYGLPDMAESEIKGYLVIVSSYSGSTEETISAFEEALARDLPLLVFTTGGKLLELAQKNDVPYIKMPRINASPRFAIGLSIKATLKAMSEEAILNDISGEEKFINADDYERAGKELADKLKDKIPLIYSSARNKGLAYFWKINFNETAKIAAFSNTWPELNHNEMLGLDPKFAYIFLNDPDDEAIVQKRAALTKKIIEDDGATVLGVDLSGPSLWHKSLVGILVALWAGYYLAEHLGIDPENTSVVENFKKALNA